jgi:hypothetical protein
MVAKIYRRRTLLATVALNSAAVALWSFVLLLREASNPHRFDGLGYGINLDVLFAGCQFVFTTGLLIAVLTYVFTTVRLSGTEISASQGPYRRRRTIDVEQIDSLTDDRSFWYLAGEGRQIRISKDYENVGEVIFTVSQQVAEKKSAALQSSAKQLSIGSDL